MNRARSEQHAVQKLYDERGKRRTHIGRLIDGVNAYIEAHAGVGMRDHAPADVSDTDLPAQLEKTRGRRERLLAELAATEAAPLTRAEVIEKAKAEIDALAERGSPSLQRLFEDGGNIGWPERTEQIGNGLRTIFAVLPNRGGIAEIDGSLYLPGIDALALIVWAHRDAIVAKLSTEIEQHYEQHPKALSREDRQKRVADLKAKLLECERVEVAIVDRRPATSRWCARTSIRPRCSACTRSWRREARAVTQPYVPVEGHTVPESYHAFAQALAREVLSLRRQLGQPVPAHEKTTVTAWRDDGSIASFIKQKVAAYDPGKQQFPHVAAQAWSSAVSALERGDVEASLRDYMQFVTGAIGDGPDIRGEAQHAGVGEGCGDVLDASRQVARR